MSEKLFWKQIGNFECENIVEYSEFHKYISIKIDMDIIDYILFSATYKNNDLDNHKLYREYEYNNSLDDLKYVLGNSSLEEEHRSYKNIDKLDRLMNIENELNTKVNKEVSKLLDSYDELNFGLEYIPNQDIKRYTHKLKDGVYEEVLRFTDLKELNQSFRLSKNCFYMKITIYDKNKEYSEDFILRVECN